MRSLPQPSCTRQRTGTGGAGVLPAAAEPASAPTSSGESKIEYDRLLSKNIRKKPPAAQARTPPHEPTARTRQCRSTPDYKQEAIQTSETQDRVILCNCETAVNREKKRGAPGWYDLPLRHRPIALRVSHSSPEQPLQTRDTRSALSRLNPLRIRNGLSTCAWLFVST